MAKRGGFGGMPGGMGGMGGMSNLMKQAQKMQQKMQQSQEELQAKEFTAKAGGGAVEVTVNGKREILKLHLAEEIVDPEDIDMLQDSIIAAINEAMGMVDAESEKLLGGIGGGLGF